MPDSCFWTNKDGQQESECVIGVSFSFGLHISGFDSGFVASTDVKGITFSTDSAYNPSVSISKLTSAPAGVSYQTTAGYVLGGMNPYATPINDINGISYASMTQTSPASTLSSARQDCIGVSSDTKGYAFGGFTAFNYTSYQTTIDGIAFSTEASFTAADSLDTACASGSGGMSVTSGYKFGGYCAGSNDVIEKMTFATEATAAIVATLSSVYTTHCGASSYSTERCFQFGGNSSGTGQTIIQGFRTDTDAVIAVAEVLSVSKFASSGCHSNDKGYSLGGYSGATVRDEIDGIDFATETAFTSSAVLGIGYYLGAGVQG